MRVHKHSPACQTTSTFWSLARQGKIFISKLKQANSVTRVNMSVHLNAKKITTHVQTGQPPTAPILVVRFSIVESTISIHLSACTQTSPMHAWTVETIHGMGTATHHYWLPREGTKPNQDAQMPPLKSFPQRLLHLEAESKAYNIVLFKFSLEVNPWNLCFCS